MDLYAELNVPRDADATAIRKAYRKASKRAHPDGGGSAEKFQSVSTAMEVLSDPLRRKSYDETGKIEDKPTDNGMSDVLNIINGLMDRTLTECDQSSMPWENVDLVSNMLSLSAKQQRDIRNQKDQMHKSADRFRKILKRFKVKSGAENRLERMIAGRITMIEAGERSLEQQLATFSRVDAMLKDHNFEMETMQQQSQYPSPMQQFFVRVG